MKDNGENIQFSPIEDETIVQIIRTYIREVRDERRILESATPIPLPDI